MSAETSVTISILIFLIYVAFFQLPINVKRYHDIGVSGKYAVLLYVLASLVYNLRTIFPGAVISLILLISFLILIFLNISLLGKDSAAGDNEYGKSTKYPNPLKKEEQQGMSA